jgi:quercetin dioxygenase-like cupin family protein/DNA-binding Xre family transcriptional regulator
MLHGLQFILDRPAMPTSPAQATSLASVGSALRQVRNARNLSLADVAEATGISASFLSLVENDRSDITIGRLVRLIDFYGISITDLLPFSARPDYPEVIRAGERRSLKSPVEEIDFYLLTADTTDRQMMPLEVYFKPGARLAEPGRHAGEEFLLVLEGELCLELEGAEPRILTQGDTAYYPAERPHLLSNASATEPLRVLCVDTPPTM